MKVGSIIEVSTIHGPGRRFVIEFAGCSGCSDCQANGPHDYSWGVDWDVDDLITNIVKYKAWIIGITLSGPDAMVQPQLREFLETLRSTPSIKHLDVWIYTKLSIDQIPNPIKSKSNVIINPSKGKLWKHVVGHHYTEWPMKDIKDFYIKVKNNE